VLDSSRSEAVGVALAASRDQWDDQIRRSGAVQSLWARLE